MSRVAIVTYVCTHYRHPLYRRIAAAHDADFYFTASEAAWYRPAAFNVDTSDLPVRSAPGPRALYRSLRHGDYDAIVSTLSGRATLVATYLAARVSRTPFMLWVGIWDHPRTFFHRLSRPLARFLYRNADGVFVYGPHVADHIRREVGRTEFVFEIPQAVENVAFRGAPSTDAGSGRSARACFVGRLDPDKGVDVLLKALALVPDLSLTIVGTGAEEARLRALAATLGMSSRVDFVGFVPQTQLRAKFSASDFLVMPSVTTRRQKEPWGLVANEAMNCGLPVIASTAVGATAGGLVIDGQTGRVVREGDPRGLAAAMSELASQPHLRARLGRQASEHVLRWNYDAAAEAFDAGVGAILGARGESYAGSKLP